MQCNNMKNTQYRGLIFYYCLIRIRLLLWDKIQYTVNASFHKLIQYRYSTSCSDHTHTHTVSLQTSKTKGKTTDQIAHFSSLKQQRFTASGSGGRMGGPLIGGSVVRSSAPPDFMLCLQAKY